MHPEALRAMEMLLEQIPLIEADVLDVGSYNVNGTYRELVEKRGWKYTGLDIIAGPNVDVISPDPYKMPFIDNRFEVVTSGSNMEHVQAIWKWIPALARMVKVGGWLAIATHWKFQEHEFPVDCWRIMPDRMRFLFNETRVLREQDIRIASKWDIAILAEKVKE